MENGGVNPAVKTSIPETPDKKDVRAKGQSLSQIDGTVSERMLLPHLEIFLQTLCFLR